MRHLPDILRREPLPVLALIGAAAIVAVVFFVAGYGHDIGHARGDLPLFLSLSLLAVAFQLIVVPQPQGAVSFASAPLLALGFIFGPAAAMPAAVVCGLARLFASKGRVERAVFDCANLAISAYAAAALYRAFADAPLSSRFALAVAAGAVYWLVNCGLLATAMSLSMGDKSAAELFRERFVWMAPYLAATGVLALAAVQARHTSDVAALGAIVPALLFPLVARLWATANR